MLKLPEWAVSKATAQAAAVLMVWFVLVPAIFGFPYHLPEAIQTSWAGDVQALKRNQEEVRASLLGIQSTIIEGQILETHARWCDSPRDQRESSGWAARLEDLQKQYKRLTGERVEHLPMCQRE